MRQVWSLEGMRAGYCIDFLIPPKLAAKLAPDGAVPLPASGVPDLHPVVRQIVAEQPDSFGTYTPSRTCFWFYGSTRLDDRGGREARADQPEVFAVWTLATRTDSAGRSVPGQAAIRMYSSDGRAIQQARTQALDLDGVEPTIGKAPVGPDDRYMVKIGKTTLIWDGHLTVDSLPATTVQERWRASGLRRTTWSAHGSFRPDSSRAMVGALRVTGKGDLAKALQASPVRWAGPMHLAGQGTVTMTR